MDCQTCREAVSARIDGEPHDAPHALLAEHLAGCRPCQGWEARAADLTRALRVRPADPVPDLAEAILESAPLPVDGRGLWPRFALGGVAIAQLTLGMSQFLGMSGHAGHTEPFAGHLFNESTAWNLAIGLGLAWAAFRPAAARGVLPVLAGFVVVLLGFCVHDLLAGSAPLARVAGHGLLVAGLVLLLLVHRGTREPAPPGAHENQAGSGLDARPGAEVSGFDGERRPGRGGGPLRPASKRGAA